MFSVVLRLALGLSLFINFLGLVCTENSNSDILAMQSPEERI